MNGEPGALLQVVALSLPAVALYMTVLNELHQDVARVDSISPDQNSPAYEGPGPATGRIDHELHRDYVTLTISMDGTDFRLATISFLALLVAAITLVVSVVVSVEWVFLLGAGVTVVAFGFLVAALGYTVYASFRGLYPG